MNYLEWSQEYLDTAEKLSAVIIELKAQRKKAPLSKKKEIDARLAQYRACYGECMQTADHLMQRYRGVA